MWVNYSSKDSLHLNHFFISKAFTWGHMSWASVSSVFSSLAAYCTFPVKRSLFPQFLMTDFCDELSFSVPSLSLPNSHQPGWYLSKSPCYSTIFLFIASHSCPLWFLLLTCLPSLLVYHLPSFPLLSLYSFSCCFRNNLLVSSVCWCASLWV